MEPSDGRSGSTISLKKLGIIVAIFFFTMATGLILIYRHLNSKSDGGSVSGSQSRFGISLRREGKKSTSGGNERTSLLSMDVEHVRKLFNAILEDISDGKEAYMDIVNFLERHENSSGLSSRTKNFIKRAILLLKGISSTTDKSGDIEILMALVNVITKRLPKK
ncbi:hypothetical protein KMI_10g16210 [Encephalitozoon hellem]|nr:hypothetical protein KMI_10g16210 [Encephalitozoon hellem]